MAEGLQALTEKEKETLRLVVRGHDAKSMARTLDLSVHTINDRLRAARRKLAVTSSKEAARLLFDSERETPENLARNQLGEAAPPPSMQSDGPAAPRRRTGIFFPVIIAGVIVMFAIAAAIMLASHPTATQPVATSSEQIAIDHASEKAAREWLAMADIGADTGDWQTSFAATGSQFRSLNSLAVWSDASNEARGLLGAVLARETVGYRRLNAPPRGYLEVTFRTDFATRKGVMETVTLEREDGELRVVGYLID